PPGSRRQKPRRRIVNMRHLVVRNPSLPLMPIVAAAHRQAAISRRADRHSPRRLISNMPIDVGIHYVLSWGAKIRERLAKLVPMLRRIHVKKNQPHAILQSPAQSNLPRLARNEFTNNRP